MRIRFHGIGQSIKTDPWNVHTTTSGKITYRKWVFAVGKWKALPVTGESWCIYELSFKERAGEDEERQITFQLGDVIEFDGLIEGWNSPNKRLQFINMELHVISHRLIANMPLMLHHMDHIKTIGSCRKSFDHG